MSTIVHLFGSGNGHYSIISLRALIIINYVTSHRSVYVWPANNGHDSLRPARFLMPASLLIANLFPALECPSNSLCFDKVISV